MPQPLTTLLAAMLALRRVMLALRPARLSVHVAPMEAVGLLRA